MLKSNDNRPAPSITLIGHSAQGFAFDPIKENRRLPSPPMFSGDPKD